MLLIIYKALWVLRGLIYKPFLGGFSYPSYIGKPTFISRYRKIFIGKKVRILPGARIEVFDDQSSIYFNDNISIGQNFHIVSGGAQKLTIGQDTTISANVFITNIEHEYREINKHVLEQPLIGNNTTINSNCFIGYGAVIQAGTTLGKQCIVGANAVVRGTFPDYSVIVGAPAKIVKRFDKKSKKWRKTNPKGSFIDE